MLNGTDWLGYVAFNGLSKSSGNRETSLLMMVGLEIVFLLL